MKVDLPYLSFDPDRHGNPRIYVRRHGKRIRLSVPVGHPDFAKAYHAALEALELPHEAMERERKEAAKAGTLGWLATRYLSECAEYKALAKNSRRARKNCIESCLNEPLKPGGKDLMRDCPVSVIGPAHIKMLRDRKADQPGAANNRRKHLSALFAWAIEADLMKSNPVRDVRSMKTRGGGYYTWTLEDVAQFEQRHPIGTKARLALALLLFTGSRRQDMVTFGRQHVKNGWLRFVPKKTLYKRSDISEKPWLPQLEEIVAASPTGDLTFLVTNQNKPFTPAGFGNWFRERCDEAGLPQCTAHGLRKAGATLAAENGATASQLMAMFDWTTISQAEVYTRAARKKRMAGEAMHKIAGDQSANDGLSHRIVAPGKVAENT